MTDATARYTSFRIALASGILGAAGATLGWLAWLTVRVANTELLVTVLVGASLGLAVHWVRRYIRVAKRERLGSPADAGTGAPHGTMRSTAALVWAAGFGFLGLVTEHLVADMAVEFLQPFLASLAALLPAGMVIGWTMSLGRLKDENAYTLILFGMGVGAVIAVLTGIIWMVGFGTAPWFALLSWWCLIGVGTRLVVRAERFSVRFQDPILAVVLVFVATLGLNLLPLSPSSYQHLGPYEGVPFMLRAMVAKIHESPAVPATFWIEAEKRFAEKQAGRTCVLPQPPQAPQPASIAVDTTTAPPPSADPLQAAIDRLAHAAPSVPPSVPSAAAEPPPNAGARTEFIRSWLVILLFVAGIGLAPWVERSLRPIDYPNSETYRRDITLTIVVVLMLVGACVYARIDRAKESVRAEACRDAQAAAAASARP